MINQLGKLGLAGLVKLAGWDTSECQLSLCEISLTDEKLYSSLEDKLLLLGISILSPIFLAVYNGNDINNVDKTIAGITPKEWFCVEIVRQYSYKIKLDNTNTISSKDDILILDLSSSFFKTLLAINVSIFLSVIAKEIKVIASPIKTNRIVEFIIDGKNSPDLRQEYINIFAYNEYIKNINVPLYSFKYLFIFLALSLSINNPFIKSNLTLIITLYLASRSEYARK